jgi:cytoskeletal protein CcmA (bactofilin family)
MVFTSTPKSDTGEEREHGSAPPGSGRSVLAPGTVLFGDCRTDGAVRIDGRVEGTVRAGHLTIGSGGRVDGDVEMATGASGGAVVIEGRVGGAVRAHRIEVAPGGSIGSGLTATEAFVRGRVTGPIEAKDRLVLGETAVVEGNVTAGSLVLHEGGRLHGAVRIGRKPDRSRSA